MHRLMISLLLLAAVACQPSAVQHAVTTGPDVEAARAFLERYAVAENAGDMEGVLALLDDDAVLMGPDARPLNGMAAIRPLAEAVFRDNTIQLAAQADEVVVAGDLAVMRASYEETVTPKGDGKPTHNKGAWLLVLRKQPDGSWKLWREMYSVFPPDSPTAP